MNKSLAWTAGALLAVTLVAGCSAGSSSDSGAADSGAAQAAASAAATAAAEPSPPPVNPAFQMPRVDQTLASRPGAAIVPAWQWVLEWRKGDPVATDSSSPGAPVCGIETGGVVIPTGQTSGALELLTYQPSVDVDTAGTPCNGGERFWLPKSKAEGMTAAFKAASAKYAADWKLVQTLVAHPIPSPKVVQAPAWQWFNIEANPSAEDMSSTDGGYQPKCAAVLGSQLTEIGATDTQVLVAYMPRSDTETGGTPCDGGELFFVKRATFNGMQKSYQSVTSHQQAEQALVTRLRAHPLTGAPTKVVGDWQWIDIVAGASSVEADPLVGGPSCGIEKPGTVTEIGADGGRVLVVYSANQFPDGNSCVGGEYFFMTQSQFNGLKAAQ